jgi:MraZ protein
MDKLSGRVTHPLDAKGRFSLPAKLRKKLPDELVIICSPDETFPSLWLYAEEAYDSWAEAVIESKGGPQMNSATYYQLERDLYGKKEFVRCDKAGRIGIRQELRQYASLKKSVVIVGVRDHFEIWDPDTLAQNNEFYYPTCKILDLP